jgi:hypothetical protein
MVTSILRQLLISAAALLAVIGPLRAFDVTDGPSATLFADVVDGEEDERGETILHVSEPIVDTTRLVSTSSHIAAFLDVPIFCGPHNERGPPQI